MLLPRTPSSLYRNCAIFFLPFFLLGYDKFYHSGHIEYAGTIGRYYKANVSVWAGKDGDGDTRYFWTSPKKATLFAATSG
jgi:hypothetical protein